VHDLTDGLASIIAHEESEWIEFKHNNCNPNEIGETISAVSNAARLHQREIAYMVWGIENETRKVIGTNFKPRRAKVKNQELENWIATQLEPKIDFKIHELEYEGKPLVVFSIQPCQDRPVAFRGTEYIRVGSYTKRLRDHPEKERALWAKSSQTAFESELAIRGARTQEVLELLDHHSYFELLQQPVPSDPIEILKRLEREKLLARFGNEKWNITNLGALLFAKQLSDFDLLGRKAVRVIIYNGRNRTETIKEQLGARGYAAGFAGLVKFINDKLPTNEQIGQALRRQARMYPEIAIRELVANAIIHQDFRMRGVSPLVEIFSDRIEITNPGQPLISTLRFIDEPPQSRNEILAGLMRRLNVCEERGSGIDKVIALVELYQLPAPEWTSSQDHTKVVMFAHRKLSEMDRQDKIRACYQHACLLHVSNQIMTNATLRKRFSIEEHNYSIASRIISDTTKAGLIKAKDPESTSRKHARYIPFWA
jgi:ATP-dependent DNA helicase RecG